MKASIDGGDFGAALAAARDALPGYRAAHSGGGERGGEGASPLLGLHYATLGRLARAVGGHDGRAVGWLQRGAAMLGVTHGRDHPLVGELQQSVREAQAEAAHSAAGLLHHAESAD